MEDAEAAHNSIIFGMGISSVVGKYGGREPHYLLHIHTQTRNIIVLLTFTIRTIAVGCCCTIALHLLAQLTPLLQQLTYRLQQLLLVGRNPLSCRQQRRL